MGVGASACVGGGGELVGVGAGAGGGGGAGGASVGMCAHSYVLYLVHRIFDKNQPSIAAACPTTFPFTSFVLCSSAALSAAVEKAQAHCYSTFPVCTLTRTHTHIPVLLLCALQQCSPFSCRGGQGLQGRTSPPTWLAACGSAAQGPRRAGWACMVRACVCLCGCLVCVCVCVCV